MIQSDNPIYDNLVKGSDDSQDQKTDSEYTVVKRNTEEEEMESVYASVTEKNKLENEYAATLDRPSYIAIAQERSAESSWYAGTDNVVINQDEKPNKTSKQRSCLCCKKFLCVVFFFIVFGALCACNIYALFQLTELKSEITSLSNKLDKTIERLDLNLSSLANDQSYLALENEDHYLINTVHSDNIGQFLNPRLSCADILGISPSSPSGYYWITNSNGFAVRVYCDMTRSCGDITGGWMRVADINMKNRTSPCPGDLQLRNHSDLNVCGISAFPTSECSTISFTLNSIQYSRICGKIKAYKFGFLEAFNGHKPDIDGIYVDGVSLTHGRSPRRHIWTFAAASYENNTKCPCNDDNVTTFPPGLAFIGQDYFCDVANQDMNVNRDNPLWDGMDCDNTCCSFNNPPWFHKVLQDPSNDDIEMRVCSDQNRSYEDIAIETVDLYVQ